MGPRTPILNLLAWQGDRRFFHQMSPRRQIALSQLPLTVSIGLTLAIVAIFHREILLDAVFVLGVLLTAVLFAACVALPWRRMPAVAYLGIPVLDFVPLGLIRHAGVESMTALGALAAFPVVWLATSDVRPRASLAMCFYGPLFMVWAPLFVTGTATAERLVSVVLLPFIMLAVGFAVRALSASMRDQQNSLQKVRIALQEALDSSARKERLLDTVVQTVGVGVAVIDREGNLTLANDKHRQIRELEGVSAVAACRRNALPETSTPLVFARGGKEQLSPEAYPVCRAAAGEEFSEYLVWIGEEDRQRVFSTSARGISDGDRFEGSVVTFTDVTDLVAAVTAKDVFLSNVTHELRTPLTSIRGYAELLLSEPGLSEVAKTSASVIEQNAQRLHRLVSDLLSASSGSVEVRPEPADLSQVIQQSLSAAAPHAAASGVDLINDVPSTLPAMIDTVRTAQVMDNLLSNAIKYSPDGGRVTVRARQEGSYIVCEVADTGIGMAEAERRQIFKRFFRATGVRNSSIPGIGLGLAISKAIVENHGGSISCASVPEQGSTFSVSFPAAESQVVSGAGAAPASSTVDDR